MTGQHRDETIQLLQDERDMWMRRCLKAETELMKWYGYVNQQRPDMKKTIFKRLADIFHMKGRA